MCFDSEHPFILETVLDCTFKLDFLWNLKFMYLLFIILTVHLSIETPGGLVVVETDINSQPTEGDHIWFSRQKVNRRAMTLDFLVIL